MKVALVVEGVFPEKKGGLERWYLHLSKQLRIDGFDVTYFNSSKVNEVRNGVKHTSVSKKEWRYLSGGVRSTRDSIRFSISLFLKLIRADLDLIYCSSVPIVSVFPAWLVARIRRKILIVEWFEYWPLKYWLNYTNKIIGTLGWIVQIVAIRRGERLITFNLGTSQALMRILGRSAHRKIRQMPGQCGGVSDLDFGSNPQNKRDFMFLGRFVDEKQPELAVRAAVRLREKGWQGNLRIFGTGPNFYLLEKLIENLGAEKYIKIYQNVDDEQIAQAMKESFILFHPTRREGYGYAQVEAAYRGVPTMLIRYPLNASTELEINPELYLEDDGIDSIVLALLDAYTNQEIYRNATQEWAKCAATSRSSEMSIKQIEDIMIELSHQALKH